MDSSITIVESRLDWLTVTCQSEAMRPLFRKWAESLIEREKDAGNVKRAFALRGYRGTKLGRIAFGEQPDSAIAQLQGSLAEEEFDHAVGLADKVTRIDPSVTVRQEPFNDRMAAEAYVAAVREWEQPGFPPSYALIDSSNHGSTLYVGRRVSERFGRVYDKYAQSAGDAYANTWRYEVECKGGAASRVAADCLGTPDRHAFCQGYVYDYFQSRGVQPIYSAEPHRVQGSSWSGLPDWGRHSKWLAGSVAPVVKRAVAQGRAQELLDLLGLVGDVRAKRDGDPDQSIPTRL